MIITLPVDFNVNQLLSDFASICAPFIVMALIVSVGYMIVRIVRKGV